MTPADGNIPSFLPVAKHIMADPFVAAEVRREEARIADHKRNHVVGVQWSGMGEAPFKARDIREILRDADFERQRAETYLTSYVGKARAAIATGCKAAEQLHARLNDVGSALSRGDGSAPRKAEDCAETLRDLRLLVADMEAFVRLAGAV